MKKMNGTETSQTTGRDIKPAHLFDDTLFLAKRRLLLHSCCGPCSSSVIERLAENYSISIFFYNPNITDKKEYDKRLEAQKKLIDEFNNSLDKNSAIGLVKGRWEPNVFLEAVIGLEGEPEGGDRCKQCIKIRLEETARTAILKGFDVFSTTLSVSPYKDYGAISVIGNELALCAGIEFLDMDFKKSNGFARSIELSKKHNLYRQNYCGCEFSK
jgi:predicted adenine nucleotide alpha hydrolase (AANH) superfamily ATPase